MENLPHTRNNRWDVYNSLVALGCAQERAGKLALRKALG